MVQAIMEIEPVINQTFLFSKKREKRCQYDSKPGFPFCEQYLQYIFNPQIKKHFLFRERGYSLYM